MNPNRGTQLFHLIEAALAEIFGRRMTLHQLAAMTSQSVSTIFEWRTGARLRQLETLLSLLERLPPAKQAEIITRSCRTLPTIWHDWLAWRDTQVSALEAILRKETGLTVIEGQENAVGFVAAALGHSSAMLAGQGLPVRGIDVRAPDRFVPVDGIVYLNQPFQSEAIRESIVGAWPSIRKVEGHLVIVTGCLEHMRNLQPDLIKLAEVSHLVISEASHQSIAKMSKLMQLGSHIVTASQETDNRIKVTVECR